MCMNRIEHRQRITTAAVLGGAVVICLWYAGDAVLTPAPMLDELGGGAELVEGGGYRDFTPERSDDSADGLFPTLRWPIGVPNHEPKELRRRLED